MNLLADTPVWSLALRRKQADLSPREEQVTQALAEVIRDGRAQLVGVVRQELLLGIREEERLRKLRDYLRAFDDPPLETGDYEEAAQMHNRVSPQLADFYHGPEFRAVRSGARVKDVCGVNGASDRSGKRGRGRPFD